MSGRRRTLRRAALIFVKSAEFECLNLISSAYRNRKSPKRGCARRRLNGIVAAERQGHHVVYSRRDARAREILIILSDSAAPAKKEVAALRTGYANGGADKSHRPPNFVGERA
jgi:hypothetical protein